MCYVIITASSLSWFILTLVTTMLLVTALATPKWLLGAEQYQLTEYNFTIVRSPSVGINTRCTQMSARYHCGPFDLDGFATDSSVYPTPWKASMFFQGAAVTIMTLAVASTLVTCCRQSVLGKSLHNCTGAGQVVAGILVMLAISCHMLGWGAERVKRLCGSDADSFYMGECQIGWSMYSDIIGVVLCFCCAGLSVKAESANMRSHIKRRIEGGERLVFVP